MKNLFLLASVLMMISVAFVATSCGDDDGVMPLPQKSNARYEVSSITADMTAFYDISASYFDLNGQLHNESVDGMQWVKSLSDGPVDAKFFCQVTARLKAERPTYTNDNYTFGYESKYEVYRPSIGVKTGAEKFEKEVPAADLEQFLAANAQKTIIMVEK